MILLSMWYSMLERMNSDEEGQGLAEYALILVFVAIVAIVALKLLGSNVTTTINSVSSSL